MEKSEIGLVISLLFVFLVSANAVFIINVVRFGARNDGRTDSTQAFVKAWGYACASRQPARIYVPRGRFLIRQVIFKGPCRNNNINFRIDGTLVAPSYKVLNTPNWIYFSRVTGVSITGGTLDGQGASYWACRRSGRWCPPGARNLAFDFGSNVRIKGLTSLNSQNIHISLNNCVNVLVQGVRIIAPANSPNTDGIHMQLSAGVTIRSTSVRTGDDCISIVQGTKNVWIENCSCGPGHGISIGSLGKDRFERGVENVMVKNVVFTGSDNGLRIKTFARPSNGYVRKITYQDIIMRNVRNPILIDQHYCTSGSCPHQESGIGISDVTYRNVQGSSASQIATKFDCSRSNPCRNIRLQAVKLTYQNRVAVSSCKYAGGGSSISPGSCL